VIIGFLEDIISSFGFLDTIVTDNDASFMAKLLINFCEHFGISLIHSTPYYPQGNGLAESSNKSLINIIKRLLEDTKKAWDSKLKIFLWANRVTKKRSMGISPFKLVYRTEDVFPSQLALLVANFFQYFHEEPNDMIRRIHQQVEV
jgi:transposase InsO family protein